MTTLYLSTIGTAPELASLASFTRDARKPSVLMSFYFLEQIRKTNPGQYAEIRKFRCMLDSGAYTAMSKKKTIDIANLCAEVRDGGWAEAAALDVIGDPDKSYENAVLMHREGATQAFPTFHFGEPWEFLARYAAEFPKVGLGGLVPVKSREQREAWLSECFSRVWPKKTHGFGVMGRETLMKFPFHSVDSTSWEAGALRFGGYSFASGQNLGLAKGRATKAAGATHLRPEALHYMKLEAEVKARWAGEFAKQGWTS